MKPINAEEIVRVFNGWLEEADSLAEREAIHRQLATGQPLHMNVL